jgi:hypothetical protein
VKGGRWGGSGGVWFGGGGRKQSVSLGSVRGAVASFSAGCLSSWHLASVAIGCCMRLVRGWYRLVNSSKS